MWHPKRPMKIAKRTTKDLPKMASSQWPQQAIKRYAIYVALFTTMWDHHTSIYIYIYLYMRVCVYVCACVVLCERQTAANYPAIVAATAVMGLYCACNKRQTGRANAPNSPICQFDMVAQCMHTHTHTHTHAYAFVILLPSFR